MDENILPVANNPKAKNAILKAASCPILIKYAASNKPTPPIHQNANHRWVRQDADPPNMRITPRIKYIALAIVRIHGLCTFDVRRTNGFSYENFT